MLANTTNPEEIALIMKEMNELDMEEDFDYTEFSNHNHFCR